MILRSERRHTPETAAGPRWLESPSRATTPSLAACSALALTEPRRCALFLDLDGTLLDLAPTPKGVVVPHGLVTLLEALSDGLGGAVAILTGRRIADVDRLLSPLCLPAAGVHGTEIRGARSAAITEVTPRATQDIVDNVAAIATRFPGAFAEIKAAGIAVHYRLAPEAKSAIEEELIELLARHKGRLALCPGRMVFELLPSGLSKGSALAAFQASPEFAGRIPVMIGDDVGDEPAFAIARALSGFGLKVAGETFEQADADFRSPAEVIGWLADVRRALEG